MRRLILLLFAGGLLLAGCGTLQTGQSPTETALLSTPTVVVEPTVTLALPTVIEPSTTPVPDVIELPAGPKLLYAEFGGPITFSALSIADPSKKKVLFTSEPDYQGGNFALSHDTTRLAYSTMAGSRRIGDLWIAEIDGSQHTKIASSVDVGPRFNYPVWSADDRYIAFLHRSTWEFPYQQTLAVYDTQTNQEIALVELAIPASESEIELNYPLAFSSDNTYLYYRHRVANPAELWRVQLQTKQAEKVNTVAEQGVPLCYGLSSDGARVFCKVDTQNPAKCSLALISIIPDKTPITLESCPESTDPLWTADGSEIFISSYPQEGKPARIERFAFDQGSASITVSATILEAANPQEYFVPLAWLPDGQWLIAQKHPKRKSNPSALVLVRRDGSEVKTLVNEGLSVIGILN